MWSPDEPIPSNTARVLLGVSPAWNVYDVALLDVIEDHLSRQRSFDIVIHLFDVDMCESLSDVAQHIPFDHDPVSSPLVGFWDHGRFLKSSDGGVARPTLFEFLGIKTTVFDKSLTWTENPLG